MKRRSFLSLSLGALALPACGSARPEQEPRPKTTGLQPTRLAQVLTTAEGLPRLHAMIVARDGDVLSERVFRGGGLDTPVNIKSASKSVLAALGGAAVAARVLPGLDQRAATYLRSRFPARADPRLERITVEHLLAMEAGLASTSGPNYGAWVSSRDWVRYALARPFEAEPGGRMIYSTGTSHLLSAVLTEAAGRSTLGLARDWLGGPLDIEIPSWPADPQGVYFGGNEMRMSPRALLRFGELYRNDGLHDGARVLPVGWVQASWRTRGVSRWTGASYGYGWWIRRSRDHDVYYAWGYGGQMVFVVPSLSLVAVMTSSPEPVARRDGHVEALHHLLDTGLIPAAEEGEGARALPERTEASQSADRRG